MKDEYVWYILTGLFLLYLYSSGQEKAKFHTERAKEYEAEAERLRKQAELKTKKAEELEKEIREKIMQGFY